MNPFQLVYEALWQLAEDYKGLTEKVKLGNRIRYDTMRGRDPEKRNVTGGDLPELVLWDATGNINLWQSSSDSSINRRYTWIMGTGEKRNHDILDIEWGLFIAMHGWKTVLTRLQWQDHNFVKQVRVMNTSSGITRNIEREENIPEGWSSLWTVQVDMYFNIKDILAERES